MSCTLRLGRTAARDGRWETELCSLSEQPRALTLSCAVIRCTYLDIWDTSVILLIGSETCCRMQKPEGGDGLGRGPVLENEGVDVFNPKGVTGVSSGAFLSSS